MTAARWLPVRPECIPAQLTAIDQWVLWRGEAVKGKHTKVPYRVSDPTRHASVDDPSSWASCADAIDGYSLGHHDGIGLVLTEPLGLVGIDLDEPCLDETSAPLPWCQAIIARLSSYTERSPGAGLRLYVYATLPPNGRHRIGKKGTPGAIEVYSASRFFTTTGWHVAGTPTTVEHRADVFAAWYAETFPSQDPPAESPPPAPAGGLSLDDSTLTTKMFNAANGDPLRALYLGGNWEALGYPSHSEADLALCRGIAFYTGNDPDRIDRIVRESALYRPDKWDSKRGTTTYGAITIAKAIASTTETYGHSVIRPRLSRRDPPPDLDRPTDTRRAPKVVPLHGAKTMTPDTSLAARATLRVSATGTLTTVDILGIGLGDFLSQEFPDAVPYITGVLTEDGCGWIGGEEKLGKTYWALAEALALALGLPLAGRFPVSTPRKVLFIEEEDPPRRTHRRLRALLRGYGLDPDDPALRTRLNAQFRIEVCSGFSLDSPVWVARLEETLRVFNPAVAYLDVLRKITWRDFNKTDQATLLLADLDRLRRQYRVLWRIVHHYRKSQGFRTGRGSQEIGGSYVLGAWSEASLFFEPVGRKPSPVRLQFQLKAAPPTADHILTIHAECPADNPTLVRLVVDPATPDHADADLVDLVYAAIATLPPEPAHTGSPGVSKKTLATHLK